MFKESLCRKYTQTERYIGVIGVSLKYLPTLSSHPLTYNLSHLIHPRSPNGDEN